MKILWIVAYAMAALCSWASSQVDTQAVLVGKLCVYHLDGTTDEYPVSLSSSAETVVEVAKGVKLHARIGEQPEFGDLVRVDHALEKSDGTMASLSWMGVPRGRKYYYGICESLYKDDSRWSVKRPLSGSVPGELMIMRLSDLSKESLKFEVSMEKATEISVTKDLKFFVTASWAKDGLITYTQYFERRADNGVWVKIDLPTQGMLPGASYVYETTDFFVHQTESRPNQALLPTPMTVTPPAGQEARRP